MRRFSLLLAGGALWLFLTAVPALADGGPHLTSVNSGTSTLTADSCAGCHRAHTAQSEFLLKAASEELLCLSCHGDAGTLATVNVEIGVQYVPAGDGTRTGTVLGALRNGGFLSARIDSSDPSRLSYIRGYEDSPFNTIYAISTKPKVGVLGASQAVNSAHIDLSPSAGDGIADTGTMWGKGAAGSASLGTPLVELTCVECHNPHGNGNFRILRPVPGVEADPLGQPIPVAVKATYTNADTIVTDGQHGLVMSDLVTLTNVGGLTGDYYVVTVTNGFTFKVASSIGGTALDLTNTTGTGTVIRSEVAVADVDPDPDGDNSFPTKNYTVLQTKGSQGVDSTYLLYARDVVAADLGNGVAADQPAVTISSSTATYFQTTGAHGLAVGDLVTVTGGPFGAFSPAGTPYTVASVSSSGTVYDRFTLVGVTTAATGSGTVVREGIPGDYSATGGDYFRRIVPWDASLVNPSCSSIIFSTNNSAYCGTANDAPNGRPATITSGPSALIGQQAFLDQMSTWCSQCHSRYYSASNENVAGDPPISVLSDIPVASSSSANITVATYAPTGSRYGSPSYGDKVTFANVPGGNTLSNATEYFVVATGTGTFQVSLTMGGTSITPTPAIASGDGVTFTRVYQSSNSSWGYPREDDTYKYQHSTASNRACTVCHVSHGSNAEMIGADSLAVPYPDGTTTSTSSRLLKVNNRGTCQMCHDPTGTVAEGTYLGGTDGIWSTTVP
ncbi:MAG TPA: cytochrome c3 family protein [Ilumatobacteraceae bacterium]|nr:cytochrome c3 family protein [Ilumatobacteraceae bacterium]